MAHKEQRDFCELVKMSFPNMFENVYVCDCGSLYLNGDNKYLFDSSSDIIGVDIVAGKNVDLVSEIHEMKPYYDNSFDVVISTEMLEHDKHYEKSLKRMYEILRPGGLMIITCATEGRPEHGTKNRLPECSPQTTDYYKNITASDLLEVFHDPDMFDRFEISINKEHHDLYFWGVKK